MKPRIKHPDWALAHKKPGTELKLIMEDTIILNLQNALSFMRNQFNSNGNKCNWFWLFGFTFIMSVCFSSTKIVNI